MQVGASIACVPWLNGGRRYVCYVIAGSAKLGEIYRVEGYLYHWSLRFIMLPRKLRIAIMLSILLRFSEANVQIYRITHLLYVRFPTLFG